MKTLVIGLGQIGSGLIEVLKSVHPVNGIDKFNLNYPGVVLGETFDIVHICFGCQADGVNDFVKEVKAYQQVYQPKYTIIHSTVPVGTSRLCGAIHSPVMGRHPYLAQSIRIFTKFIGGKQASDVAAYFMKAGIEVYLYDKQETTEAMKLLSTQRYGVDIEFTKMVKMECDELGIPFEAWTLWTEAYNEGYTKLGLKKFWRPLLVPIMTEIGGHCVLPNMDLLPTKFAMFIKSLNQQKNVSKDKKGNKKSKKRVS